VIEDMAQAAGGYLGEKVLGGFGDISIVSFYATKPWGGAYGGMVLSHREDVHDSVRSMRFADAAGLTLPYAGNHQLSDLHAALAGCRLDRAGAEAAKRRALAAEYDSALADRDVQIVRRDAHGNHFRYIVRLRDADAALAELRAHGVGAALPVDVPLSRLLGQTCPGAESARRQCVSLPLLADMSEEENEQMHKVINTCL